MDIVFNINNTYFGPETAPCATCCRCCATPTALHRRRVHVHLRHVGRRWLEERLEPTRAVPSFTAEKKKHILERLTAAEGLERYLHTKYVGQKRFSLEGGESFIASMDEPSSAPVKRACRKS
jgi:2-oxoglutarate dehydrogenase E1 component